MATIISLSRYVFLLYALLKKEYLSSEKKKNCRHSQCKYPLCSRFGFVGRKETKSRKQFNTSEFTK